MTNLLPALTEATDRFARLVGGSDLTRPIPSCPGWTTYDLVEHIGGVHEWARHAVLHQSPDGRKEPAPTPVDPPELARWYASHASALVRTLADIGPDAPAWIFGDGPPTAAWWVRRQTHETLIHTWDLVGGTAAAVQWQVEPELAWDGVREVVTMLYPRQVRLGRTEPVPATLRLTATDLTASSIELGGVAPLVDVSAPAAELYLLLWGRATAADPRVTALLDRPITP